MADNDTILNSAGVTVTVATKDIGGVKHPRHLIRKSDGTADIDPLSESDFDTKIGPLTETAPATDTASSGLNGRLQRIAQRITSLIALLPTALGTGGGLKVDGSGTALPISGSLTNISGTVSLPTGAATETTLAAQSAKLPATLGQKAMAASMSVALASDQSVIVVQQAALPGPPITREALGITDTSIHEAVVPAGAGGTGVPSTGKSLYITAISVSNTGSVDTEVVFYTGVAITAANRRWRVPAPSGGAAGKIGGAIPTFPSPLQIAQDTAIGVACTVAPGSVDIHIDGYEA